MSELPKGWTRAKVSELTTKVGSGSTPRGGKNAYKETGIPLIRSMNVHFDEFKPKGLAFIDDAQAEKLQNVVVESGDVLLNITGASIGRVTTAPEQMEGARVNQHVSIIRPSDALSSKFLSWFLASPDQQTLIDRIQVGATRQALTKTMLLDFDIPLPPLPEQRRIVNRIEELFSRLDAGVATLRHAKAQLQRYRQSVLAAAVTGQLTQTWREQHPDTEPASELLERVLKHKRELWAGKRKYKEPTVPETDGLLKLPASWTWATVEQQAAPEERAITDGPFGSKLKSRHYTESGPRVLRLQNIGDGVFKDESAHISEEHFETLLKHQIFAGDLVIRALGIPAHQACMVPPSVGPAIVKADCIRFKVFEPHINPRFILFALNSHPVRSRSEKHVHGVGRPRLNGAEIKSLALPLAPLAEQHQIVAEVEARTTAIDHLEAEIEVQLMRASVLRTSTLNFAYSGKLVPQNPSDGSARSLLQLTKKAKQNSVKNPYRKSAKTPKPPKKKGALKKPATPKEMQSDLRSTIVNKISKMKKDQFTFEDLFDSITAEYDEAKDLIFALLEDSKPMIKQEFDKGSKRLVFTRNPLK